MKKLILTILTIAVLAGCTNRAAMYGADFIEVDVTNTSANLYIYRYQDNGYAIEVWPVIKINDGRKTALPHGSYTHFKLNPGEYVISAEKAQSYTGEWPGKIELNVQAGKEYFIEYVVTADDKVVISFSGGIPVASPDSENIYKNMHLVKKEQALQKLRKSKRVINEL